MSYKLIVKQKILSMMDQKLLFCSFQHFPRSTSCLSFSFRAILNASMSFSISPSINVICSSFICCVDFVGLSFRSFENIAIIKLEILILFTPLTNSIGLLLSSIKCILNDSRLFSDNVLNEKQKCSVSLLRQGY